MSCTVSLSVVSDTEVNHYLCRSSCGEGEGKVWGSAMGWGTSWGGIVQQFCRNLEAKYANLEHLVLRAEENPKIWNYLPAISVCLLWQSKKWVLAFFQSDNSNISDRVWKWRVADPKTSNKVVPPWTLIYSLLLQRELKKSKSLRCMLNFFVSCPLHIWWGSWNLNTNPISKSRGHFKQ